MPEFMIDYVIKRRQADEDDYTEVGFGSTAGQADVDAALYEVQSVIQNRQWETEDGMPAPASV